MASISLRNINKTYPGNVQVIDNLNLEIKDKEFIILVGPSGCGKSTTLRMIAGLEDITGGEMYIGDKLVNNVPPKDRDIAMVFQNYALYPHMTVYKNIAFGLQLRKIPKDEIDRKVHEAAKILDLEHLLNRKPRALSGGQRQRVALGRAMVRDPAVFLLDEPLSNLDAKLRTAMRTEITRLHKRLDTTFVYVTHDQTEAMTMGDRIVVMKDGYIQQADTPQNLYDYPCNLFVAGFIGAPQMNFIHATMEKKDQRYYVKFSNYSFEIPKEKGDAQTFEKYVGRPVVLGIRPEDIFTDEERVDTENKGVIQAKLDIVELMGAEVYIYLVCDEQKMVVRTPSGYRKKAGDTAQFAINMNKIHLFDQETEQAICH